MGAPYVSDRPYAAAMNDVVTLVGGPLDGMTLDSDDVDADDPAAWIVVDGCELRAAYAPAERANAVWRFEGWVEV